MPTAGTRHAARIWTALAAVVLTASMVPILLVDAGDPESSPGRPGGGGPGHAES